MNVAEFRTLLACYPDDAEVGVLVLAPSGVIIDINAAPVTTIERTVLDDGQPETVWITGVGESSRRPPALITWPCACGEILTIAERDSWPSEHRGHLVELA